MVIYMYGYIYKTTDLITNKIYIGKKHSETFLGNDYFGSGTIILRIIEKYKKDNLDINTRLKVELLDIAESLEELNAKEKYYIKLYNSRNIEVGYNLRDGGDCGPGGPMFKGHKHTIETKTKMSNNRQGINNSNYGNRWTQSQELKQLHSILSKGENNGMYGKHHSDETKHKISISNSKCWMTNGIKDIRVAKEDVDNYEKQGFRRGRTFGCNKK